MLRLQNICMMRDWLWKTQYLKVNQQKPSKGHFFRWGFMGFSVPHTLSWVLWNYRIENMHHSRFRRKPNVGLRNVKYKYCQHGRMACSASFAEVMGWRSGEVSARWCSMPAELGSCVSLHAALQSCFVHVLLEPLHPDFYITTFSAFQWISPSLTPPSAVPVSLSQITGAVFTAFLPSPLAC